MSSLKHISRKCKSGFVAQRQLIQQVRRLRQQKKTIAFTNGCFDLLHIGHLNYLEKIKSKADVLIVGVNSDVSVRRLKGKNRPIMPEKERARLVAALKPVDWVALFNEETPLRLIEAVRPDFLAKGGDWKIKEIVGAEIVKARGGKVVSIPLVKGRSTTRLLQKVKQL